MKRKYPMVVLVLVYCIFGGLRTALLANMAAATGRTVLAIWQKCLGTSHGATLRI